MERVLLEPRAVLCQQGVISQAGAALRTSHPAHTSHSKASQLSWAPWVPFPKERQGSRCGSDTPAWNYWAGTQQATDHFYNYYPAL